MKSFDLRFFTLAFLGIAGLIGIGIGIAEMSVLIAILSFFISISAIGFGFFLRKAES